MHRPIILTSVFVLGILSALAIGQEAGKTLDIYFVDTEGGQSTLYASPTGQTMLVDTGNAGDRDLHRILDVLHVAGVTQLDHLLITHYHGDHYGSLVELSKQIPIKHLYDHGASVEGDRPSIATFEEAYRDLTRRIPRTIVKPGDTIGFAGTATTVVVSDGRALAAPLAGAPGAGQPNQLCAAFVPRDESKVDPDNHQSAGFVLAYGRFRTINLGDLTWSQEFNLMCPNNPIGTVDLYLTSHHGLDQSGSPAFVHAIQPRVAVMNNGTRKGGAIQTFTVLESSPGFEDLWQLHWSYAGGFEHNVPGMRIANVDAPDQMVAILNPSGPPPAGPGGNAAHAPAFFIKVSARLDGSFTVSNSRTSYSKTYAGRR
jgi:competence protein ComEC